jgi:hypothetical protein
MPKAKKDSASPAGNCASEADHPVATYSASPHASALIDGANGAHRSTNDPSRPLKGPAADRDSRHFAKARRGKAPVQSFAPKVLRSAPDSGTRTAEKRIRSGSV